MAAFGRDGLDVDAARPGGAQAEQAQQAGECVVDGAGAGGLGDERAKLHAVEAQGG